jgi:hypothetical protein
MEDMAKEAKLFEAIENGQIDAVRQLLPAQVSSRPRRFHFRPAEMRSLDRSPRPFPALPH